MSRIIPIIIVIVLLVLASGGYFLWWPEYQEFKDKRLELEVKNENVRQKEEYLSKLDGYINKFSEHANELSKIDTALSADPSKPTLYNFILKISAENGLILDSVDIGEISSEEGIQKISLSISASGSYAAFKNFLSVIHKNTRLFEIDYIGFSSPRTAVAEVAEEEGEEGEEREERIEIFTFSLVLKTYSYKEAEVGEEEVEEGILL